MVYLEVEQWVFRDKVWLLLKYFQSPSMYIWIFWLDGKRTANEEYGQVAQVACV